MSVIDTIATAHARPSRARTDAGTVRRSSSTAVEVTDAEGFSVRRLAVRVENLVLLVGQMAHDRHHAVDVRQVVPRLHEAIGDVLVHPGIGEALRVVADL